MTVIAMTKEMGSLGTYVGIEVAKRLGYEFVRQDIIREAAREFEVPEEALVRAVEERPGFRPTDASRRVLADLHLAATVRAVLKAQAETTRLDVDVRAEAGRVTLAGTVPSARARPPRLKHALANRENSRPGG